MTDREEFFLLLDISSESITSRLSTAELGWKGKRFESGSDNWKKIAALARSKPCLGIIALFRSSTYSRVAGTKDSAVVDLVLASIAAKPHLALVHEAVLGGAAIYEGQPLEVTGEDWSAYYDGWSDEAAREYFGDIDEGVRIAANDRLKAAGIKLTPYKRNAEASVLSVAFIDDLDSNLLFRLYVPANRLYESELSDLLRLFHDWLTTVRGQNVRQAGYTTARGRVVEFFGQSREQTTSLEGEFEKFQHFLALVETPEQASELLLSLGVDPSRTADIVSRYAIRARRLQVDVRQERERKSLAIRHELESELVDENVTSETIAMLVDALLPDSPNLTGGPLRPVLESGPNVVVNNQWIGTVNGVVAQHVAGDVVNGIEPEELANLIAQYGEANRVDLLNALHELADSSAPQKGRVVARQKLKAFLLNLGGKVGQSALNILQKWLETQIGL